MHRKDLKIYAFEFLCIFIAVIAAFALNNWNDNRKERLAENKILREIANGMQKDIEDIDLNILGHNVGLNAIKYFRSYCLNKDVDLDSMKFYLANITRDFITVQNSSGYESLKSRGLEIVRNDSLRLKIISTYEYDFYILKMLEEQYAEMQFYANHAEGFHKAFDKYMLYNEEGGISGFSKASLSEAEKKTLLGALWRIEGNRHFMLKYYYTIEKNLENLIAEIQGEIKIN